MKATEIVKGADYAYSTSNGYWETSADRVTVLATEGYHIPKVGRLSHSTPQVTVTVDGAARAVEGREADAGHPANAVLARRGETLMLARYTAIRMPWAEYETMRAKRQQAREESARRTVEAQAEYDRRIEDAKVVAASLGLQMGYYQAEGINYASTPQVRPISMSLDDFARLLELALKGAQA